MLKLLFALALVAGACVPLVSADAHEGQKVDCNETSMNALRADIQAMDDGEAKTAATKEMQMAQDMMANKDMKGCEAHMHSVMDAMEQ
jgi:hypothetical protein